MKLRYNIEFRLKSKKGKVEDQFGDYTSIFFKDLNGCFRLINSDLINRSEFEWRVVEAK